MRSMIPWPTAVVIVILDRITKAEPAKPAAEGTPPAAPPAKPSEA